MELTETGKVTIVDTIDNGDTTMDDNFDDDVVKKALKNRDNREVIEGESSEFP